MHFRLALSLVTGILSSVLAQFPPASSFSTVIKSPINPDITISFKQPDAGTCTTVFSSQKQYTGYVNLPPFSLSPIQQDYPINTFFWFVEARQQPELAPLTIWLNGGPGSSSLIGLFQETGPCEVVQVEDGSYGTRSRFWGFDRSSNVLFIDQPAQVGFSYDVPTNFSLGLVNNTFNAPGPVPPGTPSFAWLNGTFPSQNEANTANTTEIAAHAIWHFLQGWLSAFPQYNPGIRPNTTTLGPTSVNLFTESYGGLYGPVFATLWEEMNGLRRNGTLPMSNTLEISLASLGIINGFIDARTQSASYPRFAYNNTYGIQAIGATTMYNAMTSFSQPGGCDDLIIQCQAAASIADPKADGNVDPVNSVCHSAFAACNQLVNLIGPSGLDPYDIRQENPSPFPSDMFLEYLNTGQVMQAVGVPVNFTMSSSTVLNAFLSTGDQMRSAQLYNLAALLNMNIRVALIYGDADYLCNWMGGEAVSLALADLLPAYAPFPDSGYAKIVVNTSYVGGDVRQYGNLSFARIYDAGHQVPAYQPETAFTVFTRVIEGTAVSTGENIDLSTYRTQGPANSTHQNKAGSSANPVCWIRDIETTCTSNQISQIVAGKGVVIDGVWYANANQYTSPASSIVAGKPGNPASSAAAESMVSGSTTVGPTGVYTATSTPSPANGVSFVTFSRPAWWSVLAMMLSIF